jgi:hypothetical protein
MRKILAVLLCLALQACALPRALPVATDLQAGESEVIVIGKIELMPPLDAKLEQRTHWNAIGEERFLTRVFMATAPEYKPVDTSKVDGREFQNSLEAAWGIPFMVKAPRQRTFLNGAMTYLDVMEQDRLWFPGGYYFDVPKDATAVYIGTLRYWRNDFNRITKVEVVNERYDIATVLKGRASPSQVTTSLLKRVR